jgi:adenylate cyclase
MSARPRAPERAPHPPVQPIKRVLALLDFTGYTRFCQRHDDVEAVALLDAYYHRCHAAVDGAGGVVVKFMGDGCLASFPPERAADAVAATERLAEDVAELGHRHGEDLRLGANLHMATVLVGALGPEAVAREDVFGVGVNHTFLMGSGAGIRLSEPVYRALPSDARSPWKKDRPPARYTRQA